MRHVFLLRRCLRSLLLEHGPLRLKSAVRIVIPELTRVSTVIHAVNRGELALVSTGTSYDAIPVSSPAGRITTLLRPSHHLHQTTAPRWGKCPLSVRVTWASRLAPSRGMSGSMTPSLRRAMLHRRVGRPAQTQVLPELVLVRIQAVPQQLVPPIQVLLL